MGLGWKLLTESSDTHSELGLLGPLGGLGVSNRFLLLWVRSHALLTNFPQQDHADLASNTSSATYKLRSWRVV